MASTPTTPSSQTMANGTMATGMSGVIHRIMRRLEGGLVLKRFYSKKRPEKRMFQVKLETRQLVWQRPTNNRIEGYVDLREVREIRTGKGSKEFDKWSDELGGMDYSLCFVLLYGSDFRLKTVSVLATNKEEFETWVNGLRYLVEDTQHASYPLQEERWLRKEFYNMESRNNSVSLKDIKSWLPRINLKISNKKLQEKYQEIDPNMKELNFEGFAMLYHNIVHSEPIMDEHFGSLFLQDREKMFVEDLVQFLRLDQKDSLYEDSGLVKNHMLQYLDDAAREARGVFYTRQEFLDYLFSQQNSMIESKHNSIYQDMNQPLSNYWIASSHNTYLTGDQFSSESSCEAYARCLRMGCRCIELDCWDGPDGYPHVYHGHTLTTKIRFLDVVKIIKEHAWVASEYPLILSIENHCSIPQQRNMAQAFKDIFGDELLTEPVDHTASMLPSPDQLKRKIILKHKKLPEGVHGNEAKFTISNEDSNVTDADLSNSVKNGILFLEDPVDKEWHPHFFVLTATKLHYTEETLLNQNNDEDEEEANQMNTQHEQSLAQEELHYSEKWFHGKLEGGRKRADELLREYSYLGDGTFLVRESDTFVGDFSLSFWFSGRIEHSVINVEKHPNGQVAYSLTPATCFFSLKSLIEYYQHTAFQDADSNIVMKLTHPVPPARQSGVNHCRIKSKQERGQTKYYLIDNLPFDSLYSLINHYRQLPLQSQNFNQVLTEPVPQPQSHEGKDWYHDAMDRGKAEDMLKRIPYDGAFLVRRSEQDQYSFAISFRWYHDTLTRDDSEDMLCRLRYDGAFLVRRRRPTLHDTDPSKFAISFRAEGKIKHCRIKQEGRLFTIGTANFESLVELVQYYQKNPLYRKMKLRYPVNEQLIRRIGQAPDETAIYGPPDLYMNPNDFTSKLRVRALYDYVAHRDDELSFCKNAVITNVQKQDEGWWKGDYNTQVQQWFPSNYVQDIEPSDESAESPPLGSLQKGSLDLTGVSVVVGGQGEKPFLFRIITHAGIVKEIAADSEEECMDWVTNIRNSSTNVERKIKEKHIIERTLRIAKELSDLIVYCRPVPFEADKGMKGNYYEMCSFPESKVEKYCNKQKCQSLIEFNHMQFSRVYPKGQRIDSSNYEPMTMWNCGCHMLALNYQTPDRAMQLNEGRFSQNGKCGFILQPDCLRAPNFNPYDRHTAVNVDPVTISLTVIGARHLVKPGRGIASPFVEVEVVGADYDSKNKYKTRVVVDNGLNPVWNEMCEFDILNPQLALLRFVIQDEDMFGDPNFLGQCTIPLNSIRNGFRAVPLKNGFSEELELASLLILIDQRNPQEEDSEVYSSIQELRDQSEELQSEIEQREQSGDQNGADAAKMALISMEQRLLAMNEARLQARKQKKNAKKPQKASVSSSK